MSYKDVRDLSEHLKQLDYPHRFTIATLYTPHGCEAAFHVVAEILQWLCGRLEPGATLLGGAHSVPDRVMLIRSAAEFFVTKASIRLNTRRLYASNVTTAGELLKVTALLMQAPQHVDGSETDDEYGTEADGTPADLGDKIEELRRARELSSDLTRTGASLYDLLAKELTNKEQRNLQATRPLELALVEKNLKTAIHAMTQKVQSSRHQLETSRVERNTLVAKVERKSADLERVRQRLEALQKIRPAFLEEFERLESELKSLFDQYIVRVRCVDTLRALVAASVKMPNEVQLPVVPVSDTSIPFLPDGLIDSDEELIDVDDDDELRIPDTNAGARRRAAAVGRVGEAAAMAEAGNQIRESRATTTRLRVQTAANRGGDRRFVGTMMGGSDMDSSMGSDEVGGSDDDEDSDLGEEFMPTDEDDVRASGAGETMARTRPVDLSDEDF